MPDVWLDTPAPILHTIMMTIAFALLTILWLVLFIHERTKARQFLHQVSTLTDQLAAQTKKTGESIDLLLEQADIRNDYLDYVIRYSNLHLLKPHVTVPAYEEDRCVHCFYPIFAGHADDCAWLHCRPLTEVLYPAPTPPPVDPTIPDGNTILFPEVAEPEAK